MPQVRFHFGAHVKGTFIGQNNSVLVREISSFLWARGRARMVLLAGIQDDAILINDAKKSFLVYSIRINSQEQERGEGVWVVTLHVNEIMINCRN